MPVVELPIFGPTYTNRSLPVGAQVTRNFYPEVNEQGSKVFSLMPFPGLREFADTTGGPSRGFGDMDGVLYSVNGNTLYCVDSGAGVTSLGTIDGNKRCILESDGTNLIVTNGLNKPYSWDGSTLTAGTDVDLHESNSCAYINRRIVYDAADGKIAFADLGDPLAVNSLNVTIAESDPDSTNLVWSFRQQIYAAGNKTIQPYWNSGQGNPPYSPVLNAVQKIGVHAIHSVATNKDNSYFLGSDLNIYQFNGLQSYPVGNPAICQKIRSYLDASDAYGVCFSFDSLNFYLISFPTGNETWLFQENTGLWTNLAYGADGSQHLISDYRFIYNKHLVSDRRNGKIYELDFDKFTDNGDLIQRQRDTISIDGATFGRPGARVFMRSLQVVIDPGVSLVSAESQMIMQYSDDNGRTWSSETWSNIGAQGDYKYQISWYSLGSFYNRMFRFRMTDAVKWCLVTAYGDVEVGID